jgi:hypothetical protein
MGNYLSHTRSSNGFLPAGQWRSFKENPGRAKLKKNTNNHVVGSSPFLFKTKPNFLGLSSSLVPEFNLCSKVGIDRELRCK